MTQLDKERLTVRLPSELNEKLTSITSNLGLTKNAFVLNLIIREIKKSENSEKFSSNNNQ